MDPNALLRAVFDGTGGMQLRMAPHTHGANDADDDSMDTDDIIPPLVQVPRFGHPDPVITGISRLTQLLMYTVEVQHHQFFQQINKRKWNFMGDTGPLASFHGAYERVLENLISIQHVLVTHARHYPGEDHRTFQSVLEFRDTPGSDLADKGANPSAVYAAYITRKIWPPENANHPMFEAAWGGLFPRWVGGVLEKCDILIETLALLKQNGPDILAFKFRLPNRYSGAPIIDTWKMFYMAVIENILGKHADRTFMQWVISPESPLSVSELGQLIGMDSCEPASIIGSSVFHRTPGQHEEREPSPKRQAIPIMSFEDTTIETTLKTYSKLDNLAVSFDQIVQFTQWLSKQSTKLLPASFPVWGNARLQALQACTTFENLKQDLLGAPFSWSAITMLFAYRCHIRRFLKMLQNAWLMTLRRLMGSAKKR